MSGGRAVAGEQNGRAKLTEEQVIKIRELFEAGTRIWSLAEMHGVTEGAIRAIVRRDTWKHI